jgi:hypothetical protein
MKETFEMEKNVLICETTFISLDSTKTVAEQMNAYLTISRF